MSPPLKLEFSLWQTFKAQLKDYMAGNFTNERKVLPGEPMYAGYAFGTKFIEVGGSRPEKAAEPNTKVTLDGFDNPKVKFQFYLGENAVPVFTNTGEEDIKVNSATVTNDFPDGQKVLKPGEWVNLPYHGGAHYGVDLPSSNGNKTRLVFQNQSETSTGETITQIVYSPIPTRPATS